MIVERRNNQKRQEMLKENSPHRVNEQSSTDSIHWNSNLNNKTLIQRHVTPSKMATKKQKGAIRGSQPRQKGAQNWKHKAVLQLTQKLLISITGQLNDRDRQSHQTISIALSTLQLHRIKEIQQLISDLGQGNIQPDRTLPYFFRDEGRRQTDFGQSRQNNGVLQCEKHIEEIKFMHSIIEFQEKEIKEVSAELYAIQNHYRDLLFSMEMKEKESEQNQQENLPSFGVIKPVSIINPQHSQQIVTASQLDLKNKNADELKVYDQLVNVNTKLRELNKLMEEQLSTTTERVEALNQESAILEEYLEQITQKVTAKEEESRQIHERIEALMIEVQLESQNLGRVQDQLAFMQEQVQMIKHQEPTS